MALPIKLILPGNKGHGTICQDEETDRLAAHVSFLLIQSPGQLMMKRKWRLDQEKTCRRRMTGRYLLFLDVISGSQINTRYERKCQCEPDDIHKREGRPAKEVLSS